MLLDGKVLGEVPADEAGKLALKVRTMKALKKEKVQYVVWIMIGSTILYNTFKDGQQGSVCAGAWNYYWHVNSCIAGRFLLSHLYYICMTGRWCV